MEQSERTEHKVEMSKRSELTVSGVEDVLGFDDGAITVKTVMGIMNVEGEGLHISKLDVKTGILNVDGRVTALYYSEPVVKKGLFKRSGG